MTKKTEYAPGTPSYVDLSTTDPDAAKAFYSGLFGWRYNDLPTGDDPGSVYSMVVLGDDVVAGLQRQPEAMRDMGVPPIWSTYVTVTDVDATTAAVEGAGGAVMQPAFDVMDAGRMSVIADPTGAVICTWQPKNSIGATIVNEPGAFTWNELISPDVPRAGQFYNQVFGWEPHDVSMGPMQYTEFRLNGTGIAGGMPPPMDGIPPSWTVYFAVADTDATVADVKQRGGSVLVEPTDIPPGRFAVLVDPQGAAFNVIKTATPPG